MLDPLEALGLASADVPALRARLDAERCAPFMAEALRRAAAIAAERERKPLDPAFAVLAQARELRDAAERFASAPPRKPTSNRAHSSPRRLHPEAVRSVPPSGTASRPGAAPRGAEQPPPALPPEALRLWDSRAAAYRAQLAANGWPHELAHLVARLVIAVQLASRGPIEHRGAFARRVAELGQLLVERDAAAPAIAELAPSALDAPFE